MPVNQHPFHTSFLSSRLKKPAHDSSPSNRRCVFAGTALPLTPLEHEIIDLLLNLDTRRTECLNLLHLHCGWVYTGTIPPFCITVRSNRNG